MKPMELQSTLTKKDVLLTVQEWMRSDTSSFRGTVTENSFSITKHAWFSNNVLNPQIHATLSENENGTRVSVRATLNRNDKIGFAVLLVLVCCITICLGANAVVSQSWRWIPPLIAVVCFESIVAGVFALVFRINVYKTMTVLKTKLTKKAKVV